LENDEPAQCTTVPMIITGHDDDSLESTREIPETRKWLLPEIHVQDKICKEALLFICLRNGDFAQVNPIEPWIKGSRP